MNHLVFAFALCAALAVYPGGLAVLGAMAAQAAPALPALGPGPIWVRGLRALGSGWGRGLAAVALAGLAVAPLPWPGNPVAPVTVSWAAGRELGGPALTLGALIGLLLLASPEPARARATASACAWSLGLVLLALAVGSAGWSGLLSAPGLGAELVRVFLGVGWPAALGWNLLPGALPADPARAAAWAAGSGVGLLLALPQLLGTPFWVALLAWWALALLLGAGSALLRLGRCRGWTGPAPVRATGRLNVP